MRVVNASTSLGKKISSNRSKLGGGFLNQVYDKWSTVKQKAWDKCYDEYCRTDGAEGFSICSHNSFQFTCSWFIPDGMRLETRDNSYLVVFDE